MKPQIFWGMTIQAGLSALLGYNNAISLTWQHQRDAAFILFAVTLFSLAVNYLLKPKTVV